MKHLFIGTEVMTPHGKGVIERIELNADKDRILYAVLLDKPFKVVDQYTGEKEYGFLYRSFGYQYSQELVTIFDNSEIVANEAHLEYSLKSLKIIKEVRKNRGVTQKILAMNCGITKSYLSMIESGKKEPTLKILLKIANCLKIKITDLFDNKAY